MNEKISNANSASLKTVIEKLESLFSKFNERFYEGELQKPVITVSPDTTKGAYGWCTSWKAWTDSDDSEGYYEINIFGIYKMKFKILQEMDLITIRNLKMLQNAMD